MSVSFYKIQYEPCYLGGRNEANWLANHLNETSADQTTKVFITEDTLEETLENARACNGKCQNFEGGKKEHDRITKEMATKLPELLKDERERRRVQGDKHWKTNTWLDVEICW